MTRNIAAKSKSLSRDCSTMYCRHEAVGVRSVWHTKTASIQIENTFHGKDLSGKIKITGFDIKK